MGTLRSLLADIGRPTARGTVPILALGALLGMILGGVATSLTGPSYSVSALVQGAPATLDPFTTSEDDERYAQTEAAYADLDRLRLQKAMEEATGDKAAKLTDIAVINNTTILKFTATASTADKAVLAANTAAQEYEKAWRDRIAKQIQDALNVISGQLAAAPGNSSELQIQQGRLTTQLTAATSLQRVIEPADLDGVEESASYASGAVLGMLVGLMGAVGVLLIRRRKFVTKTAGGGSLPPGDHEDAGEDLEGSGESAAGHDQALAAPAPAAAPHASAQHAPAPAEQAAGREGPADASAPATRTTAHVDPADTSAPVPAPVTHEADQLAHDNRGGNA